MTSRIVRPLALAVLAMGLAGGGPAVSAEAVPDAPTVTAPTVTAPVASAPGEPGVADQIAAYLRDSPVARLPAEDTPQGVTGSGPKRQPHGVVDVAVGSHGYRSVYVRSDLPIGETGTLSIAVGETRGGRGLGPGYGPEFGGSGFGAGRIDPRGPGCRSRVGIDADRPCLREPPLAAPLGDASDDHGPLRIDPSR